MKKIFTLMAAAFMAVGVSAQTTVTWDFAGAISEDDAVYKSDATNWAWTDSRWNYKPA